ncbi:MAG: glycosyltransferase [Acidaminococcaceae bacterium]|nr:glycosyltransferase [Acidaminococcaceae bacterium]
MMNQKNKITVYTQVYNSKPYLAQCIDSVLNQTYSNFEYILVDNGSSDGSGELLQAYEIRDSRIRLIRFSENMRGFWHNLVTKIATGKFFAVIDSDDWWEPDYLERLLKIAESTCADIACTGRQMHEEWSGRMPFTKAPRRMVINRSEFANFFPLYRVFFCANWMKLLSMDIIKSMNYEHLRSFGPIFNGDHLNNVEFLRHANRIVIDDSMLYHYRLHKGSMFYTFDPKRLDSDRIVYKEWRDFISSFGPISRENEHYFTCYRFTLCRESVLNAEGSSLSPAEKLQQYRRIITDPQNADIAQWKHPYIQQKKLGDILDAVLRTASEAPAGDEAASADFRAIMAVLSPNCGKGLALSDSGLLAGDSGLRAALVRDNRDEFMERLVAMIRERRQAGADCGDLAGLVRAFTAEHPTLRGFTDVGFIDTWPDIFLMLWREAYADALTRMSELVRSAEASGDIFMELYLSLAAIEKNYQLFLEGEDYKQVLKPSYIDGKQTG